MIPKNISSVNNYFLYARKSTDVEDKQVRSIEDQLAVLRLLAKEQGLTIADEFIEKQSAKRPGRAAFAIMLARIQKGEAQGIVCWKLDRLARNPVDAAQIEWLLQEGTIKHIQTPERSYYPADNVMLMNVEFGIANQYVRDLSTNTKRGLYQKAKRGEYPGLAPLGYFNDLRSKTIVQDKNTAPIVKQAFERYAESRYSLEDIATFFFANGIETKATMRWQSSGGNAMKRDQAAYILSNPFYCGLFRYGGELHQGNHHPIVTKQLFDKVQEVLKQRGKTSRQVSNPKPLCGLFRCGECGRSITAETKTKHQKNGNIHHYLYYRCTKKNTTCSQLHIRAEELDKQLSNVLKGFIMPKEWGTKLEAMADKDAEQGSQTTAAFVQDLRLKIQDIDRKQERLFQGYLEQDIEPDKYRQEKNKLTSEKKTHSEQIVRLEQKQNIWLAPLKNFLKDAQKLGEITLSPELHPKKSAAQKIFGSHLFLKNQKIVSTPQTQWAALSAALGKVGKIPLCNILVGRVGIEPTTTCLRGRCYYQLSYRPVWEL